MGDSTDAVSVQHNVDCSSCAFRKQKYGRIMYEKKCKNSVDRRMVFDSILWKDRQWEHLLARDAINSKQKLGSQCCTCSNMHR